ncbi:MAG: holo-ACP synthase [Dermatophilaceae bacterium]
MIIGIGIDVVDIERFGQSLARTPDLAKRLFTEDESRLPLVSVAARFAAKEALAKALHSPRMMAWKDVAVVKDGNGRPSFDLQGTVLARAQSLGVRTVHLSISHDSGVASAVVVAED